MFGLNAWNVTTSRVTSALWINISYASCEHTKYFPREGGQTHGPKIHNIKSLFTLFQDKHLNTDSYKWLHMLITNMNLRQNIWKCIPSVSIFSFVGFCQSWRLYDANVTSRAWVRVDLSNAALRFPCNRDTPMLFAGIWMNPQFVKVLILVSTVLTFRNYFFYNANMTRKIVFFCFCGKSIGIDVCWFTCSHFVVVCLSLFRSYNLLQFKNV